MTTRSIIAMALGAVLLPAGVARVGRAAAPAHSHASPPGVVALDVYAQGPVVDVLTAVQTAGGLELRHQRSRDGGGSWSAEHGVPVGPEGIHGAHRGADPQVAAVRDRLVAVWTRPGTSPWGSGALGTALSSDGGRTWRAGPNPADDGSTGGHGYADVVADAAGEFHLVWLDSRDGGPGLRAAVSRDAGTTWSANRTAQARTCECCWNRVASPRRGVAWALYRADRPRDMAVVVTEDGGATWSPRGVAGGFAWSFEGCPHVGGGLAFTRSAASALVWTGEESRQGLYVVSSRDGGRAWGAPRRLGAPSAHRGDLAASGEALAAAWDDPAAGAGAILAATSPDGGRSWTEPKRLSAPSASASHPLVVAVGPGRFLVAWTEQDGDGPLRWAYAPIASSGPR